MNHRKLLAILRGERPRAQRAAARGGKQAAEANRVPPGSQTLADAAKAGHRGTFATRRGPASKPAKRREIEPVVEASSDISLRRCEGGRSGRKADGEPDGCWLMPSRGASFSAHQRSTHSAVVGRRIPYGVKLVSKAGEGSLTEPRNFIDASRSDWAGMIEATVDRGDGGRSPRSSLRAGKPLTWQRGAVGGAGQQEVGECPTR